MKKKSFAGRSSIDTDVREHFVMFYLNDDISYQAPGIKDKVTVRRKVTKEEK